MQISAEMMSVVVAAASFICIFLLISGFYLYYRRRAIERNLNDRVQRILPVDSQADNSPGAGKLPQLLVPVFKLFGKLKILKIEGLCFYKHNA